MSVETYGAHECKVFFAMESNYGQLPSYPQMYGINTQSVEPLFDPGLLKVYGVGSRDYQALYACMRKVHLKVPEALSSYNPITFIQHAIDLTSLSIQAVYYKGLWAAPNNIISYLLTGCKINKLTVECKVEDILKANAELIGQNVTRGTALQSGATYNDASGAVPFNLSYVQKGNADGSSLASAIDVQEWKFEVDNNLKEVPVITSAGTSLLLKYLRERNRKLTGTLLMEFENDDQLIDILADTEFSLAFGLSGGHQVLFTYCKWDEFSPNAKIENLVGATAKFTARGVTIS